MGKNPAFLFYPNDWNRDMEEHPLEIQGAWIVLLCKLWWSETRGEATKNLEEWARILREKKKKTEKILHFLQEKNIASVHFLDNQNITIISRRMVKDCRISKIRQEVGRLGGNPGLKKIEENRKVLDNQIDNQNNQSPVPVPVPTTKTNKYSDEFLKFYSCYPLKKSKQKAFQSWTKQNPDLQTCLLAIEKQITEKRVLREKGKFYPEWKHPATWLNQGCWEDETNTEPETTYEAVE